jgi:hypothetical protein
MKPVTRIAVAMFVLIAVAHVARVVLQVEVTVAGAQVPLWMSGVAAVAMSTIAVLLERERRTGGSVSDGR